MEDRSKAAFRDAVAPWRVIPTGTEDFGIDCLVEIADRRGEESPVEVTGQRFAVQLKSTSLDPDVEGRWSQRVSTSTVFYWLRHNLPVMLVLHHAPSDRLLWRWIDDDVVRDLRARAPGWIAQKEVAIQLSEGRGWASEGRSEVRRAVIDWRRPTRVLHPDEYRSLLDDTMTEWRVLGEVASSFGLTTASARFRAADEQLRDATYTVALVGPARAGKSSLMNALLRRDLSPVGKLPTTAVPVLVTGGAADRLHIQYIGGSRDESDLTVEAVARVATQEQNEDNRLQVGMVTLEVVNDILACGIRLADLPGLYDPSDQVRAVTERMLESAHAVVYAIDVSAHATGGFSIPDHVVRDLRRLGSRVDRLFVVLSKCDVLDAAQRTEVAAFVERELRKYRLWEQLPGPPILLAIPPPKRGERGETLGLTELEDHLWSFLLRNDRTGAARLAYALNSALLAVQEVRALLRARAATTNEAVEIEGRLTACADARSKIADVCRDERGKLIGGLNGAMDGAAEAVAEDVRGMLAKVPSNSRLPDGDDVRAYAEQSFGRRLVPAWDATMAGLRGLAGQTTAMAEHALEDARGSAGDVNMARFEAPPRVGQIVTNGEFFGAGLLGAAGLAVVGAAFGPGAAFVLGILGFGAGLFVGKDLLRKREIAAAIRRIQSWATTTRASVLRQGEERISVAVHHIEAHANARLDGYARDMRRQLELRKKEALSPEAHAKVALALARLDETEGRIADLRARAS